MAKPLPRITYSNVDGDFAQLHRWLDDALPRFRGEMLGRAWPNVVAGRHDVSGRPYEVTCPFDRDLLVARLVAADRKAVKSHCRSARGLAQMVGSHVESSGQISAKLGQADRQAKIRSRHGDAL